METSRPGASYVHARPFSHGLQAFQYRYRTLVVYLFLQLLSHFVPPYKKKRWSIRKLYQLRG
jgi:hypothetical protein